MSTGYDAFSKYVNSITGWPQSQPNYTALPTPQNDDWLNLSSGLNYAKGATGLAKTGANMFDMPELGAGLQGASGLLGIGTGANKLAEGNYIGGAGDIVRGAGSTLQGAEGLGLTTLGPAVSGGAGIAGGLAGLGTGGYQLSQGDMTGISSLYGGALGTAAGVGTLAGTGALGASAAAAAPMIMASAINPVTLGAGFFLAMGLMNMEKQKANQIKSQTEESGTIRKGADDAMQRLARTGMLAQSMEGIENFSPEEQKKALASALEAYRAGMDGSNYGQVMLSNAGQGGSMTKTDALTPEVLNRYRAGYYPALHDTETGFIRAADATAQLDQPVPDWALKGFGQYDPAALLNSMQTGDLGLNAPTFNPYWDVDYSQAVPGTYGSFIPGTLAAHDPNFAASRTGQGFASMPALDLAGSQPVSPQEIAAMAATRQGAAENIFNINTGQDPNVDSYGAYHDPSGSTWQTDPSAIAFSAPYLPGGSQSVADYYGLSPEQVGQLQSGDAEWRMILGQKQAEQNLLPNSQRLPAFQIGQDTLDRIAQSGSAG